MGTFATRAKVEAFFAEFAFLSRYFSSDPVTEVKVRRWDDELLDLHPSWYLEETLVQRNIILLLNRNYDIVAVVGQYPKVKRSLWNPLSWFQAEYSTDSTSNTISKLGELASQVIMVAWCQSRGGRDALTVYKPPHGYKNIKDWFDARSNAVAEEAAQAVSKMK